MFEVFVEDVDKVCQLRQTRYLYVEVGVGQELAQWLHQGVYGVCVVNCKLHDLVVEVTDHDLDLWWLGLNAEGLQSFDEQTQVLALVLVGQQHEHAGVVFGRVQSHFWVWVATEAEVGLDEEPLLGYEEMLVILAYLVDELDENVCEELHALVIVETQGDVRYELRPHFVVDLVICEVVHLDQLQYR